MEERYCQSCGMPMGETNELYGTNADGTKSEDYCKYCFNEGKFLKEETMEEMIETCVPIMVKEGYDANEARKMMEAQFPMLKRWKK